MRFKLFTARQQDGESFDEFLTELRKLSQDCDFASLQDSLFHDMIIVGILDKRLQEHLLRESEITLENTMKHCQAREVTKKHVKILQHQAAPASVAKISTKKVRTSKSHAKESLEELIKQCKFCSYCHKRQVSSL